MWVFILACIAGGVFLAPFIAAALIIWVDLVRDVWCDFKNMFRR